MKIKTTLLYLLICATLLAGCQLPFPVPTDIPPITFEPPELGWTPQPAPEYTPPPWPWQPPPATGDGTDNLTVMLMYGLIAFLAVIVLVAFLAMLNRNNKPPKQ